MRDNLVNKTLIEKGWKVIRIWECELKKGLFEKKILDAIR